METSPSLPVHSVPEFIAYAKANPGKINMASAGNGTAPHIAGELFKMMAGVDLVHVTYKGDAPAITDQLSSQVQGCGSNRVGVERIRRRGAPNFAIE